MHQIRECDSAPLRKWADFEYSVVFRTKNHSLHTNFYPQFDLGWIPPRHESIGLDAKNKNRVNGSIFAPKKGFLRPRPRKEEKMFLLRVGIEKF